MYLKIYFNLSIRHHCARSQWVITVLSQSYQGLVYNQLLAREISQHYNSEPNLTQSNRRQKYLMRTYNFSILAKLQVGCTCPAFVLEARIRHTGNFQMKLRCWWFCNPYFSHLESFGKEKEYSVCRVLISWY